jgi:hypothetical protein
MVKKLTVKTQELNPKLPQYSSSFSKCISILPESKELKAKKGSIYALFDLAGDSNFDTELVTKVIRDVIHDTYFSSENISPVQSMERAVSETVEKVAQLSNDTLISNPQNTKLNFVIAILWGSVIYVVKFGNADAFIMKGGDISTLEMVSEGKFSSFSKLAEEDEILLFCTKTFSEIFPMDRLLTSSISESDMGPDQSCMLIRLIIDTSPDEEKIDYGIEVPLIKTRAKERVGKVFDIFVNSKLGAIAVFNNLQGVLKPIIEKIEVVVEKLIPRRKAVLISRRISQIGGKEGKKTRGWVFLTFIAILLAISVFYTFKSSVFKEEKTENKTNKEVAVEPEIEKVDQEDRSRDEEFKIKRVSPEVFYDIKIADENANPTETQVVGEKLVVVDKDSGKIFISDISTPTFSTNTNTFPGIRQISQSDGLLSFIDNEGYKTYDISGSGISESYNMSNINLIYPYSGYIYSITNDILTRSSVKNGALEGILWGQNSDFANAKDMAIAYSVYILKDNGELVNYSGGVKTDFTVIGLDKPFSNPVKISADLDLENIYVADKGNKRIVVLNEDGELVKQYKHEDTNLWADINSISVSSDEKTIFILDSSKVYKLNEEE